LIGGLGHAFLNDVAFTPRDETTIPHLLFIALQATFCILTVALVSGAVVERMRFGPYLSSPGCGRCSCTPCSRKARVESEVPVADPR
jgi:Ammonium Transporter Family